MARKHVITEMPSKDGTKLLTLAQDLYEQRGILTVYFQFNKQGRWELKVAPADVKRARAFAAKRGMPLAAAQPIEEETPKKKTTGKKAKKVEAKKAATRKAVRPVGGRVLPKLVDMSGEDEEVKIIRPGKKAGKRAA